MYSIKSHKMKQKQIDSPKYLYVFKKNFYNKILGNNINFDLNKLKFFFLFFKLF